MLMVFQEHTTVTDGGLLLKGTACHVMLFSGMVVRTGWFGTKMIPSSILPPISPRSGWKFPNLFTGAVVE